MPASIHALTSAISACEKGGKWEEALRYLERMTAEAITPTLQTYSAAISVCALGWVDGCVCVCVWCVCV